MTTDHNQRAEYINELRDLAAFLQAHPTVPIPAYGSILVSVQGDDDEQGIAVVQRTAAAFGVDATGLDDPKALVTATKQFGPIQYQVYRVRRPQAAEYVEGQKHLDEWRAAGKPPVTPVATQPRRGTCEHCGASIVADDRGDWIHTDGIEACAYPTDTCAYPVNDPAEAGAL